MTRLAAILAAVLCLFATAAEARHGHHPGHSHMAAHRLAVHNGYHHGHHRHYHRAPALRGRAGRLGGVSDVAATELAHPAGCPSTAFCGCGASVEVFGHSRRDLWLAAAWFRFPPAQAAPGMVAVRSHHVMVIRSVVGPGMAVVYDANSGHHRTQLHTVSLAGYSIRNPHGG